MSMTSYKLIYDWLFFLVQSYICENHLVLSVSVICPFSMMKIFYCMNIIEFILPI